MAHAALSACEGAHCYDHLLRFPDSIAWSLPTSHTMAKGTASPTYGPYKQKSESWMKHSVYYLENGNLFILVEDTLFSVWDTSFRRHSKYFESTLAVAKYTWSRCTADGTDEEHPLLLRPCDFVCLLSVIYPRVFGEYEADSAPQWITILDLSTRWKFDDIHQLAIKELLGHKIESVQKIELEHKYNVQRQWAYEAYIDLCSRGSPLTRNEAKRLGIETATLVNQAREKLEKSGRKKTKDVARMVCYMFELTDPADATCCAQ